jgi:hypothetical protein
LLHIVSSTPANKTFTLALAFLGGKEEHYVIWALTHFRDIMGELPTQVVVTDEATAIRNAITIVFKDWRQILCRWHLANTVKKACNDHEATREEEDVVIKQFWAIASSTSAEQFQQLRDEMILHWARADSSDPNHVGPMEHVCSFVLRKLELAPHFVSYHLADVMHLNELNTSRNEGHHSAMKRNLPKIRNNMLDIVSHCLRFIRTNQMHIFQTHHMQMDTPPLNLPALFANVSQLLALRSVVDR